jgi:hypothetical protein
VSEPTRRWEDVVAENPVNEARARIYERLLEAQELIAHGRYARGVPDPVVRAALDAVDERITPEERREDLYLAALSHYVGALGGRLELAAVFDDAEAGTRALRLPVP